MVVVQNIPFISLHVLLVVKDFYIDNFTTQGSYPCPLYSNWRSL